MVEVLVVGVADTDTLDREVVVVNCDSVSVGSGVVVAIGVVVSLGCTTTLLP